MTVIVENICLATDRLLQTTHNKQTVVPLETMSLPCTEHSSLVIRERELYPLTISACLYRKWKWGGEIWRYIVVEPLFLYMY